MTSRKVLARAERNTVPESVTHQELLKALEPLFELLGIHANCILADSLEIRADEVRFLVVGHAADGASTSGLNLPLRLEVGQGLGSVWCAPLSVKIDRDGDA